MAEATATAAASLLRQFRLLGYSSASLPNTGITTVLSIVR